jgi:hypothetical protein
MSHFTSVIFSLVTPVQNSLHQPKDEAMRWRGIIGMTYEQGGSYGIHTQHRRVRVHARGIGREFA